MEKNQKKFVFFFFISELISLEYDKKQYHRFTKHDPETFCDWNDLSLLLLENLNHLTPFYVSNLFLHNSDLITTVPNIFGFLNLLASTIYLIWILNINKFKSFNRLVLIVNFHHLDHFNCIILSYNQYLFNIMIKYNIMQNNKMQHEIATHENISKTILLN